jgi:hypothetical protein
VEPALAAPHQPHLDPIDHQPSFPHTFNLNLNFNMKTFSCIALLALALGVAANPVQLENRATTTLTTPAPEPTCGVNLQSCEAVKCCKNYLCVRGVSDLLNGKILSY